MPMIYFEGQYIYVPGVYTKTKVESSLPGPAPAFLVPVLVGHGHAGQPYDVAGKLVTGEVDPSPFKLIKTGSAMAEWAGEGSELHRAMVVAKNHGLPYAYAVNLSPMTRASLIAETAGNVSEFVLYPPTFGPIGGWYKIGLASGVLTLVPPKRWAMLSANLASSGVRAYLEGKHAWATVGATIVVGANAVAGVERQIVAAGEEISSTGQRRYWIEIDSAVGSACNTSAYALILQYQDTPKVFPAVATCQALIDLLNASGWRAVATAAAAFPADVATPTAIKDLGTTWGTYTAGTAPAVTSSDADAFVAAMNGREWARFVLANGVLPRMYCVLSADADVHTAFGDYARAEATRGDQYKIGVHVGCAWGDVVIDAGDSTDPVFRAQALNNQFVALAANGANREAAYLSLSPAVWARRISGGVGHNLTNDELLFSEWETEWDEINSGELTALCRAGVITNKLSIGIPPRFKVSQGVSTLQANAVIWNPSDASSWSLQQQDFSAAVQAYLAAVSEEAQIGADRVTKAGLQSFYLGHGKALRRLGWVKDTDDGFRIVSTTLNSSGNGYDVAVAVKHPTTNDYLTITTTILVGEE